jgi:predicted DsbA family dithiol-disulfide isomerase
LIAAWAPAALAQAQCAPLRDADRARLVDYVQKRYKAPPSMKLEISEVSLVGSGCFRRLLFQSAGGAGQLRLELFASPDLRFLTRELLDSTLDPAVEERQRAEALAEGLTHGSFPVRGDRSAPVTIAVFSDFQCPYCARFAAAMKDLTPEEARMVRLVFHNFPLPMHPWARPAAEAARCAQEQGDSYFWALHDFMFDHQKDLTRDNLLGKLASVTSGLTGFDQGKFAMCIVGAKTEVEVGQDVAFAQQNGINATPTVFVNGQRAQVGTPEQLHALIRQFSGTPNASKVPPVQAREGRPAGS